MKKLCVFLISFLLLKFSLILCGFTETRCFWRIKSNEENDRDLRTDCGFALFMTPGHVDEDFYNGLIDFG